MNTNGIRQNYESALYFCSKEVDNRLYDGFFMYDGLLLIF